MKTFQKIGQLAKRGWEATKDFFRDVSETVNEHPVVAKVCTAVAAGVTLAGGIVQHVRATVADASAVLTDLTTKIDTVTGIIASVVGFFLIVGVVKWARKK